MSRAGSFLSRALEAIGRKRGGNHDQDTKPATRFGKAEPSGQFVRDIHVSDVHGPEHDRSSGHCESPHTNHTDQAQLQVSTTRVPSHGRLRRHSHATVVPEPPLSPPLSPHAGAAAAPQQQLEADMLAAACTEAPTSLATSGSSWTTADSTSCHVQSSGSCTGRVTSGGRTSASASRAAAGHPASQGHADAPGTQQQPLLPQIEVVAAAAAGSRQMRSTVSNISGSSSTRSFGSRAGCEASTSSSSASTSSACNAHRPAEGLPAVVPPPPETLAAGSTRASSNDHCTSAAAAAAAMAAAIAADRPQLSAWPPAQPRAPREARRTSQGGGAGLLSDIAGPNSLHAQAPACPLLPSPGARAQAQAALQRPSSPPPGACRPSYCGVVAASAGGSGTPLRVSQAGRPRPRLQDSDMPVPVLERPAANCCRPAGLLTDRALGGSSGLPLLAPMPPASPWASRRASFDAAWAYAFPPGSPVLPAPGGTCLRCVPPDPNARSPLVRSLELPPNPGGSLERRYHVITSRRPEHAMQTAQQPQLHTPPHMYPHAPAPVLAAGLHAPTVPAALALAHPDAHAHAHDPPESWFPRSDHAATGALSQDIPPLLFSPTSPTATSAPSPAMLPPPLPARNPLPGTVPDAATPQAAGRAAQRERYGAGSPEPAAAPPAAWQASSSSGVQLAYSGRRPTVHPTAQRLHHDVDMLQALDEHDAAYQVHVRSRAGNVRRTSLEVPASNTRLEDWNHI